MGVIVSLYMLQNCVYGCGISMCLYGGLGSFVIFSSICDVHPCIGCCCKYVLHATVEGLIITIIAYMIRKGVWLLCCCMWLYRYGSESVVCACRWYVF